MARQRTRGRPDRRRSAGKPPEPSPSAGSPSTALRPDRAEGTSEAALPLFLACPPGLEALLAEEAAALDLPAPTPAPGGVETAGTWADVWRANLWLRGASRVLVRFGAFRALHLAQLDKRARRLPWAAVLRPDVPVRVEAACRASRIYHDRAAASRVARAIAEEAGVPVSAEAGLRVLVRIEDDLCTVSLDTSGAPLHRRGTKQAVGKAPLRETLAALLLRACGFNGEEPVIDPMCGSGTFVIEAAGRAAGLAPGASRAFAFERLATFDAAAWTALCAGIPPPPPIGAARRFFGFDRDAGAVEAATANAARAGVSGLAAFRCQPASALAPPPALEGTPGLVMVNPPYGGRIGDRDALRALHGTLGKVLRERFSGWRVGLVTSEETLARATGLPFAPPGPPVPHGSLKVRLWQTGPLP